MFRNRYVKNKTREQKNNNTDSGPNESDAITVEPIDPCNTCPDNGLKCDECGVCFLKVKKLHICHCHRNAVEYSKAKLVEHNYVHYCHKKNYTIMWNDPD